MSTPPDVIEKLIDNRVTEVQRQVAESVKAAVGALRVEPPPKWHGRVVAGIAFVLGLTIVMSLIFISRNLDILNAIINSNMLGNPHFAWSSMGVLGQVSLRILAVYFGAAAMLAGTATAFYSASGRTDLSGEGHGVKVALATASPGIAAVLCGAIVVCVCASLPISARYDGERLSPTDRTAAFKTADEVLKEAGVKERKPIKGE